MQSRNFHKIDPVTDLYIAFSILKKKKTYRVEHVGALNYFSWEDPTSYSYHATKRTHHAIYKIVIKDDYLKSEKNLDQYGFVWVCSSQAWY